ncbi:2-succinyl-5-enolpyruvyl-6-hydroxy-3-cyclohexene-1-carboxylate synthase [Terasakiella brassicae]|uniref:2-succinyl-5-enolpyruvyl-6-hydroxy-3-cyclohexene-1-carboxylate synthase n=1 Tax=Terasakiella brassicae TaxID=1634917 RepID=A0A917BT91_9PROT|nr:2-succinyl-5-enolpyruvyl-6-hydroxy-3-cyclohexene-1-carboxylic-acid synthase [Terasakiella brassicae]GGF55906.1 2-succinyl-5-enolpyruvyl-6-hydroxy-3-cyclohexene-1-carboxylate synthase [Terasakiella brassicae]
MEQSDQGMLNYRWAFGVMDGLAGATCCHVVVSPGARSTPLVLAAHNHPDMTTHVILDERSAAFFALGLAKSTGVPVALVCTSGTAPAHWHPAVLEADAACIPLVLLSADRPPELRGCGANQTTDQIKLFGSAVRAFSELPPAEDDCTHLAPLCARLVKQSLFPKAGPVHLNLSFREPLLPSSIPQLVPRKNAIRMMHPRMVLQDEQINHLAQVMELGDGVIVCGEGPFDQGFDEAVCQLADLCDVPVLADPLANLRSRGGRVLSCYDAFLKKEQVIQAAHPRWVLRFGAQSVSKSLGLYLSGLSDSHHLIVDGGGGWSDPCGLVDDMILCDPLDLCVRLSARLTSRNDGQIWQTFFAQEQRCRNIQKEATLPQEAEIIQSIVQKMDAENILFCGNSTPIRLLDSFLNSGEGAFDILCNRGLSGIEGNISTALGVGAARKTSVVALVGDLTLTHDISALGIDEGVNLTLVVLNNGGGGIFEYLAQANLDPDCFERYWVTPSAPDFAQVARGYGRAYYKIEGIKDFSDVFQACLTNPGIDLIEVVIDRKQSTAAHQAYWQAVTQG